MVLIVGKLSNSPKSLPCGRLRESVSRNLSLLSQPTSYNSGLTIVWILSQKKILQTPDKVLSRRKVEHINVGIGLEEDQGRVT